MAHVDSLCFCKAGDETLEHLFFECQLAQILIAWVFQQLHHISPIAGRLTVEELLFGFSEVRRRAIPSIIIFMLLVMKHTIWVARCDFRFRQRMPIASKCLSQAIAKLKFILGLLSKRCRSPAQVSKETKNDDLNLHSMTKLSGWLRYCTLRKHVSATVTILNHQ